MRPPSSSEVEAITMNIQRMDQAKLNIGIFNKLTLCVTALSLGNNIYTKIANPRDGIASSSVWWEALQSKNNVFWKKQHIWQWSLFGDGHNSIKDFGSYPNILNVTSAMREDFHPVVKLPLRKNQKRSKKHALTENNEDPSCLALEHTKMNETYNYIIKDFTQNNDDNSLLMEGGKKVPQLLSTREEALAYAKLPKQSKLFDVGKYDEDRRGMYTSSLFSNGSSQRTIHVGLDIGGPSGTAVHAFERGIVHSAGYNAGVGDYGNVIVIEHHLRNDMKVYALYGHLSSKSIQGRFPGQKIKRGQSIGYLGNTAENGGWTGTHLHFQLAVHPPATHDMPGAVTLSDRHEALMEYVDPRYVLGELY